MKVRIAAIQYMLRPLQDGTTVPLYDKRAELYAAPVRVVKTAPGAG